MELTPDIEMEWDATRRIARKSDFDKDKYITAYLSIFAKRVLPENKSTGLKYAMKLVEQMRVKSGVERLLRPLL